MTYSGGLLPPDSRLLWKRKIVDFSYNDIVYWLNNKLLEMLMINVGVHSEQSFQNSFNAALKMWWKFDTDLAGEKSLVI